MNLVTLLLFSGLFGVLASTTCDIGCLKCGAATKCEACDTSNFFYMDNESCVKFSGSNCLKINEQGKCLECNGGYLPSPGNNSCVKATQMFPNCLELSSRGDFCQKCEDNFTLSANKKRCVHSIKNCKKMAESNDHSFCEECESGFILSENSRVCFSADLPNCVEVSVKNGKCIKCIPLHRLTDDHSKCLREIPHCDVYHSSSNQNINHHCDHCVHGYHLSTDDTECFPYPEHCLKFDFKNRRCKQCEDGFAIATDGLKCFPFITNCADHHPAKSTDNYHSCRRCFYGYELVKEACIKKAPKIKIVNCKVLDESNNRCEKCTDGFQLSNDGLFCYAPVDFCVKYNFNLGQIVKCERCYPGSQFKDNKCIMPEVVSCRVRNPDGSCALCEPDYAPTTDSFKCLRAIEKCTKYTFGNAVSQIHFCTECQSGFYLSPEGLCKINPIYFCKDYDTNLKKCYRCINGFRHTDDHEKCLPEIVHCSQYLPSTKEFMAHVCKSCKSNATFWKGKCNLQRIPNCEKQDPRTGLCDLCDKSFRVTDDQLKCLPETPFCEEYATSSVESPKLRCIECAKKFALVNGVCSKQFILNCDKADDDDPTVCVKCSTSFKLTEDHHKCLKKIDNCASYAFSTRDAYALECRVCKPAYYLADNVCKSKLIQHCNSISKETGLCTACDNGFQMTDDHKKCLPEIEGCAEYFESDESVNKHICRICKNAFIFVQGNCQHKIIKHCEKFNRETGQCDQCIQHFQPSDNKEKCLRSIDNCLTYFPTEDNSIRLFCQDCEVGYQLVSGYCQKKEEIPECAEYDASKTICLHCNESFIPTGDNLKCLNEIKNCKNYYPSSIASEELFCEECKKNYVVIGRKCEKQLINNCHKTGEDGGCEECISNYRLTDDKLKCLFVVHHCLKYEPSSVETNKFTCVTCKDGFELREGKCYAKSCLKSNLVNGQCEECQETHLLTHDKLKCLAKIAECVTLADSSVESPHFICLKCKKGYRLSDNTCTKIDIPNCIEIDAEGLVCKSCSSGFVKTDDSLKCLEVIKNCSKYEKMTEKDKEAKCEGCEPGFFLSKNKCMTTDFADCEQPDLKNEVCLKCADDLILTSDSKRCLKPISHCSSYTKSNAKSENLTCSRCADQYELINNKCLSILNCQAFDKASETCKTCAKGFVVTPDKKRCLPEIPRCSDYTVSGSDSTELECKKCNFGYQLVKNHCRPKFIRNCQKLTEESTCQECNNGFQVTNDGLACLKSIPNCIEYHTSTIDTQNHLCVECLIGFDLVDNQRTCDKKVANCLDYNLQKTQCKKCKPGYELISKTKECGKLIVNCSQHFNSNSSQSIECSECENGYQLSDGNRACVSKAVGNCVMVSTETGMCRKCLDGFRVTDDGQICLRAIKNCDEYKPSGKYDDRLLCQQCKAGYQLKNDLCVINETDDCLNRNKKSNECEKCPNNTVYIKSADRCLESVANCQYHYTTLMADKEVRCKSCSQGFESFNDGLACEKAISNCREYSNEGFFCVQCQPDYILSLDGEKCIKEINGCMIYDEAQSNSKESICAECEEGYLLKSGRKQCTYSGNSDGHHDEDTGDNDVECEEGWRITSDGTKCLPEIDNCKIYDYSDINSGYHTCIECARKMKPALDGVACALNK